MRMLALVFFLVLPRAMPAAEEAPPPPPPPPPSEITGTVSGGSAAPSRAQAEENGPGKDCLDVFFDPRSVREFRVCGTERE